MSLHLIRKLQTAEGLETITISNLTEKTKEVIIQALGNYFEFNIEDKNNCKLIIANVSKDDMNIITDIVNKIIF
tara:strand:- start:2836 stop:3057 length:222 start_codon:yes stop_codon:yes gene_type:complete